MRVGMSNRHLSSFQGVSLQGGSSVGAGRPLRDKFRPSATSISKYNDTWETLKIQSSRQETSQPPWSEEWNGKIVKSHFLTIHFFKNLQIPCLPEGLSSEHICSARSLTPREPSPILSGFQPCRWPLWTRIWTTAEIRSCRNYGEREKVQRRASAGKNGRSRGKVVSNNRNWHIISYLILPSTHLCYLLTCDNLCWPCSTLGHGHDERRPFFCSASQGICKEDNQLLSTYSRGSRGAGLPRGCRCCQSMIDTTHALVDPLHHGVWCQAAHWGLGERKGGVEHTGRNYTLDSNGIRSVEQEQNI